MDEKRKEYLREYQAENKEYLKEYHRKWVSNNPDKAKESQKKYREKNRDKINKKRKEYRKKKIPLQSFLRRQVGRIQNKCKLCRESAKDKFETCDVNLEYLTSLWETQGGKCALTGKNMTHRSHSLFAVSVDRIDSSVGYVKGNIQLVCQSTNYAKSNFTNEQFLNFWNDQQEEEIL